MSRLHITIVGGSIAGCSAAILLSRSGHDVHVYERSRGGLVGRGGGIGTPTSVLTSLVEQDIVDADLPHLTPSSMPFTVRTAAEAGQARSVWGPRTEVAVFHWTSLWRSLRSRVADDRYHSAAHVVDAVEGSTGRVEVRFDDGSHIESDLVVWSDGYRSLGRRLLFPEVELDYRGYMLWRGLLPERALDSSDVLESAMPMLFHRNIPGSTVMYLVPGTDGSSRPGRRLVNWGAYIALPAEELTSFMIDRSGDALVGSIPPGRMQLDREHELKELLTAALPDFHANVVAQTAGTSVQLIHTTRMPAYHRGHMLLAGDAGSIAPPFTGSGVFKGLYNVGALIDALERHHDLDLALEAWDASQVRLADGLLALGDQLEDAMIWNTPDLATADAASTKAWWSAAVAYPSYLQRDQRS